MSRRKGELTKAEIDRGWPFQVALPERLSCREHWQPQHEFCQALSLCSRGHSFYRDGEYWNVKCFADQEHAERFRARFGGELVDASLHPQWWRK